MSAADVRLETSFIPGHGTSVHVKALPSGIFKSMRQENYSTEPDRPEAHTASSGDDTSPFSRLTLNSYPVHSFSLLYLQSQVLEDQLKDHSEIYSYVT